MEKNEVIYPYLYIAKKPILWKTKNVCCCILVGMSVNKKVNSTINFYFMGKKKKASTVYKRGTVLLQGTKGGE